MLIEPTSCIGRGSSRRGCIRVGGISRSRERLGWVLRRRHLSVGWIRRQGCSGLGHWVSGRLMLGWEGLHGNRIRGSTVGAGRGGAPNTVDSSGGRNRAIVLQQFLHLLRLDLAQPEKSTFFKKLLLEFFQAQRRLATNEVCSKILQNQRHHYSETSD